MSQTIGEKKKGKKKKKRKDKKAKDENAIDQLVKSSLSFKPTLLLQAPIENNVTLDFYL